jgi:hypothetical protein
MRDAGFDLSFRDCPAKGGTGGRPNLQSVRLIPAYNFVCSLVLGCNTPGSRKGEVEPAFAMETESR